MGRPPMQVKPVLVRLTIEALEKIDAIAGPNRRSEFIRDAVSRELKRLAKQK